MILNSNEQFDNPTMPDWLIYNLLLSFKNKNVDNVKGYGKLWEAIRDERRNINQ